MQESRVAVSKFNTYSGSGFFSVSIAVRVNDVSSYCKGVFGELFFPGEQVTGHVVGSRRPILIL